MNPFDLNDLSEDNFEELHRSNIPSDLSWDQMAPGIYAGMEAERKKQKQRIQQRSINWTLLLLLLWIGPCVPNRIGLAIVYFPIADHINLEKNIIEDAEESSIDEENVISQLPETNINFIPNEIKTRITNTVATDTNSIDIIANINPALVNPKELSIIPIADTNKLIREWVEPFSLINQKVSLLDLSPLIVDIGRPALDSSLQADSQESSWNIAVYGGYNNFEPFYSNEEDNFGNFENSLGGYQVGIRLQKSLSEKWSIQSGVEWQSMRYRFNQTRTEDVKLFRPQTVDTIFVNLITGDSTFTYRDSVNGTRTTDIQNFNYHQSINFPLLIGYRITNTPLNIQVNTGLSLRYLRQSTGITASPNSAFFDIEQDQIYKEGFIIGGMLELTLDYTLSPKWSVYTQFGLEKSFSNWLNQEGAGFSKQPLLSSVNLGLRIKL